MIKHILTDFSNVLLYAKDKNYTGKLNALHKNNLELSDYDFWEHFEIDRSLLDFYKSLSKKMGVHIFTSGHIQDYPPIREIIQSTFKTTFISADLDINKDNHKAYELIADKLKCAPVNIVYIDDSPTNTKAALQAGMQTIRHTNSSVTREKLSSILNL